MLNFKSGIGDWGLGNGKSVRSARFPARFVAAVCLLIGAMSVAGCDGSSNSGGAAGGGDGSPNDRVAVVCTTGMVGDVARAVAGDLCDVTVLMKAGIDPHLYKATRSDVERLTSADVVFYNGLLLEGKMSDALVRVSGAGVRVVALTEAVAEESLLEPEDFHGQYDPHVWMDPRAWREVVGVVRDALIAELPGREDSLRANADAYLREVDAVDAYAERVLATVPEGRRALLTAHDAFNYFGRRYGFEVVGIQGISTESEAGVRDIERLVGVLVSRGIPAVFVESTVSDRNIRALVEGAAARGHTVAIGGELFSDAMGEEGTYEGTYVGMIDHNVTTIARALGGEAPELGMNGRLARPVGAGR